MFVSFVVRLVHPKASFEIDTDDSYPFHHGSRSIGGNPRIVDEYIQFAMGGFDLGDEHFVKSFFC